MIALTMDGRAQIHFKIGGKRGNAERIAVTHNAVTLVEKRLRVVKAAQQ